MATSVDVKEGKRNKDGFLVFEGHPEFKPNLTPKCVPTSAVSLWNDTQSVLRSDAVCERLCIRLVLCSNARFIVHSLMAVIKYGLSRRFEQQSSFMNLITNMQVHLPPVLIPLMPVLRDSPFCLPAQAGDPGRQLWRVSSPLQASTSQLMSTSVLCTCIHIHIALPPMLRGVFDASCDCRCMQHCTLRQTLLQV